MIELFTYDFMVRALIVAGLVGMAAPTVGVFLVQRRLSLMGDGIGHMALTGVAAGVLTATSPVLTALIAAVIGALAIELLRERGRAAADVALALIFYGGIAAGAFLISLAPNSATNLVAFLFGSVLTVTAVELRLVAGLSFVIAGAMALFGRRLFAVSYDEEFAQVSGLNVRALNILVAVASAVVVVVAMRVVGLLMVAALMVIPVAAVQNLTRSFRSTVLLAAATGVVVSLVGVGAAFYLDAAPGASIVLLALLVFAAASTASRIGGWRLAR